MLAGGVEALSFSTDSKKGSRFLMTSTAEIGSEEDSLRNELLTKGYVIRQCESEATLLDIRSYIVAQTNLWVARHGGSNIKDLGSSHRAIPNESVNDARLQVFADLNANKSTRKNYFSLAANAIQLLVGNDLAMQNKVNLSIQQPADSTSVLDVHSDVWSGDSPFQVVLWVPLTDASSTNAMFLLPPNASHEAVRRSRNGEFRSMSEIQNSYQSLFSPINVKFGEILIFDSSCLHGNQLNTTDSTRWSLNCRFVSLMAPAISPERRLGSYYSPILVRPATEMGLRAIEALDVDL